MCQVDPREDIMAAKEIGSETKQGHKYAEVILWIRE